MGFPTGEIEGTNRNGKNQLKDIYAKNQNRPRTRKPQGRVAKRMAGRAQETAGERKEVLETARRTEPSASQAALGQNRKGIRLRRAGRQGDAGRSVPRQEPAYRLSF